MDVIFLICVGFRGEFEPFLCGLEEVGRVDPSSFAIVGALFLNELCDFEFGGLEINGG